MLLAVLRMTANSKALRQACDYHIDWEIASTQA